MRIDGNPTIVNCIIYGDFIIIPLGFVFVLAREGSFFRIQMKMKTANETYIVTLRLSKVEHTKCEFCIDVKVLVLKILK